MQELYELLSSLLVSFRVEQSLIYAQIHIWRKKYERIQRMQILNANVFNYLDGTRIAATSKSVFNII